MALIGDRERERAAALLREHYLRGRLTVEELGQRLEVALGARRDSEVRGAFRDLPSAWRDHAAEALPAISRSVRRTAFVMAVWSLWWIASVALLVGFVAVAATGDLTWATAIAFPAIWLAGTLAARHVARRGRS